MTNAIHTAAERDRNWGKWGESDQVGTLNYITSEKIVEAARLVRKGKVFSLAIEFNQNGPQMGGTRANPTLMMRSTGADYVSGSRQRPNGFGAADDNLFMSLQAATHWDALSHIFDRERMWNGYSAENVNSSGAKLNGAHTGFRISGGNCASNFAAANCSARRRLPPSPTALKPNTGTSQLTVNDCA